MCNGLDIAFNLGCHWCYRIIAFASLIPLLCFGQFSSNDSANLENIAYYISYLQSNHTELSDINAQLSTLYDLEVNTAQAVTVLNSLASTLQSLTPGVIGSRIDSVRIAVEDVGDMVYYLRQDNNKYHKTVTNTLNQGFADVVDALDNWGYGISNVIANIQPSGAIYTNMPFLSSPTIYDFWVDDYEQIARDILYFLTGIFPTDSDAIANAGVLLAFYGQSTRFWQDMVSTFGHPDSVDFNGYDMASIYDTIQSRLEVDTIYPHLEEIGQLRYYEYGTRPLITLFEQYYAQATNDYPVVGSTIEGTGTNSAFSSSFVGAVGGLAENFAHSTSVDDDISDVDTNSIVNIENDGYQSRLNEVTVANMSDTSQIDAIADAVANIQNEYQSLIGINSTAQQYIFDFGTVGAFGTSKAVSFTLTRPSSPMYWHVQDFFFAVLKAIALLTTVYSIYVHIAADTQV